MPYVTQEDRERLDAGENPRGPGELNYVITKILDEYLSGRGGIRYAHLNEVVGVLECAKLELYRRLAAPYEDRKIVENGDVYASRP